MLWGQLWASDTNAGGRICRTRHRGLPAWEGDRRRGKPQRDGQP
jgi:hypothetical protein